MLCEGILICYTEATDTTDRVPRVQGLTPLEASRFLPSVVFKLQAPLACGSQTRGLAFSESHHVDVATKILVYGRRGEVQYRVLEEGVT